MSRLRDAISILSFLARFLSFLSRFSLVVSLVFSLVFSRRDFFRFSHFSHFSRLSHALRAEKTSNSPRAASKSVAITTASWRKGANALIDALIDTQICSFCNPWRRSYIFYFTPPETLLYILLFSFVSLISLVAISFVSLVSLVSLVAISLISLISLVALSLISLSFLAFLSRFSLVYSQKRSRLSHALRAEKTSNSVPVASKSVAITTVSWRKGAKRSEAAVM